MLALWHSASTITSLAPCGELAMPRSSWKGYLKLSLVSVPVRGYTANVAASEIRLNQLHSECHNRIRYQKTCPVHGEIPKEEIVSGYEYAKGEYVVIEPEELTRIRGERERAVTLDAVVSQHTIDPVYFTDKTYYLVPDGAVGQKPLAAGGGTCCSVRARRTGHGPAR
jgi:DNA end-binding protein Ku